jgi:hypothetical protein
LAALDALIVGDHLMVPNGARGHPPSDDTAQDGPNEWTVMILL